MIDKHVIHDLLKDLLLLLGPESAELDPLGNKGSPVSQAYVSVGAGSRCAICENLVPLVAVEVPLYLVLYVLFHLSLIVLNLIYTSSL
jgi:hypothetical protein